MRQRTGFRRVMGMLAAVVALTGVAPVYAQTRGMDHRDDRRDDRSAGRAAKQECKAGDEDSRAECRQEKRDTKHGEGADEGKTNEAPAPAANPAQ